MSKHSFFGAERQPYYIWCSDYETKFAGIKALHHLCHALNEMGEEAYLIGCTKESMHLRTPRLKECDVLRHQQSNRTPIVVYPEVVSGNPLKIPHVVRWLLNRPGHLGGDEIFDSKELLFAYTADFIPEHLPRSMPILCIPVVDTTIFNNLNNPDDSNRQGYCFYANKYLVNGQKLTEHVIGATSLGQDVALSQQDIANILRRSECLYCYEPSSIITEALLCGCPVVMIPTPYLAQHFNQQVDGDGIAMGSDTAQLQRAKDTVHKVTENYQKLIADCWVHVRCFIDIVELMLSKQRVPVVTGDQQWVDASLDIIAETRGTLFNPPKKRRNVNDTIWIQKNTLQEGQATIMAERMHKTWHHQPTFHLIVVLNQDELNRLPDTLESLQQQLYSAWGLTILSNIPQPEFMLDLPDNIEWVRVASTLNDAINNTVKEAGLDWLMQLMPGDKLLPHALFSFADWINENNYQYLIYSDEMRDLGSHKLLFKPDFNLELLRSTSYLGRSAIIRRDTFERIGGYTGLAYVYMTDLTFNVYESWGAEAIGHIADVLYIDANVNVDEDILSENELTIRVAHLEREKINAQVLSLQQKNTFHTEYLIDEQPLVSIIIANKNNASTLVPCVQELKRNTTYEHYELIIVDQMSDIEDMPYIYRDFKADFGEQLTLLSYSEPNYSAMINYGVSEAKGDYVLILSSMVVPVNERWLTEMITIAQQANVGVVGVRVVEHDEPYKMIHGGGVLGVADDVHGLFEGEGFNDFGYMNRANVAQEYSFVSSAGFIVAKYKFHKVGGLDEGELANSNYCVTDFCLKIKQDGDKNIWTPHAVLRQAQDLAKKSNGVCDYNKNDVENIILRRWPNYCRHDAAYNRNLSLRESDYSVDTTISPSWSEQYNRLRVMAFPFNSTAIGEYRVRAPLNALAHEGMIETSFLPNHESVIKPFTPTIFELYRADPDVLLLNYTLSDEHYEMLKWIKENTTIFVIFSIDDLIHSIPRENPSKKRLYKDIRHRLRRTLSLCDRLIVSTQPLADDFKDHCQDIVVLPNRLDASQWLDLDLHQSEGSKLRVGWAGGELHAGDLALILDVVKETAAEVDWIFMGMCPKEIKPYVKEVHEFVAFNEYPVKLAGLNLDLAIAPLEINDFNEAKSNLRLLEYGILGWPVICTDIYPYQHASAPVVRVTNDKQAWLTAIRQAVLSTDDRSSSGVQLQKWVEEHFILQDHLQAWLSAITPLKGRR